MARSKRVYAWVRRAGAVVRVAPEWAGQVLRSVPGIVGAGLVAYGLGLVYWPLLFLAAGGFLLALDRRL